MDGVERAAQPRFEHGYVVYRLRTLFVVKIEPHSNEHDQYAEDERTNGPPKTLYNGRKGESEREPPRIGEGLEDPLSHIHHHESDQWSEVERTLTQYGDTSE